MFQEATHDEAEVTTDSRQLAWKTNTKGSTFMEQSADAGGAAACWRPGPQFPHDGLQRRRNVRQGKRQPRGHQRARARALVRAGRMRPGRAGEFSWVCWRMVLERSIL